ncbi:MAG TPA: zf-HC2 domain-containing protein [Vicinamibacteria bacterium]
MREDMTCARAEELLSDHQEGTLAEPLRRELEKHLAGCAACRALREELAFVATALGEYPDLLPSSTLAARAAEAALRAKNVLPFERPASSDIPRPLVATGSRTRVVRLPAWAQSLAAGLALVTVGLFLLTTRSEAPARAAANIVGATVNTGAYLAERKDRLMEDVRVLRVVIETAFEGRVETVGERVEDYRKLLERRRTDEPASDESSGAGAKKTNQIERSFPNRREADPVTQV